MAARTKRESGQESGTRSRGKQSSTHACETDQDTVRNDSVWRAWAVEALGECAPAAQRETRQLCWTKGSDRGQAEGNSRDCLGVERLDLLSGPDVRALRREEERPLRRDDVLQASKA